ncbi:uracil-DNA glycosylase [Comamonadaceae bacterium M7527]|nr:uracil-DNA glycosylase [Comamonadaceae bacterium M7527]
MARLGPAQQLVASGKALFESATGQSLLARLQGDLQQGVAVYPPQPLRALLLTPLPAVRVLILGQDPYHHQAGQANGLAFSVAQGIKLPPSLRNIYKELYADQEAAPALPRLHGCLDDWARQGVLLLNTALTVRDSEPASHANWGWAVLSDALVRAVASRNSPCVYVLWGAHAQSKQAPISEHAGADLCRILTSNHPSPLSASRGPKPFFGSRVFSRINHALQEMGVGVVQW